MHPSVPNVAELAQVDLTQVGLAQVGLAQVGLAQVGLAPVGLAPVDLTMAELMAARLCHDMAGLCGILAGTLELAVEEIGDGKEAMTVAADGARALIDRLRLLRAAWGHADDPIDRGEIQALSAGLPGAHRLRVCLSGLDMQAILPPELGHVVLNAMLLGAESLPMGGTLSISGDETGVEVAIAGPRAGWPEALPQLLADPSGSAAAADRLGPRGLQAPLLAAVAATSGITVRLVANGAHQPILSLNAG
jgi:histidine phosphotransferase ChpT